MPNHVHLALETDAVSISRVVHALHFRYAQYFNRRYGRSGHLFQGRFKGFVIDRNAYLLEVVRYIHRNPVKAGLSRSPEEFPWSSHHLYLGTAPSWLAAGEVLSLLTGSRPRARRLFQEFVAGTGEGDYDPEKARVGVAVGTEDFVRAALERSRQPELVRRNLTVQSVAEVVAREEGVTLADLAGPSRVRSLSRARGLCALLGRDVGAIPVARTARYLRRDPSTLSRDVARLVRRLEEDPEEAKRYGQLRDQLSS
jgi:putative transposase